MGSKTSDAGLDRNTVWLAKLWPLSVTLFFGTCIVYLLTLSKNHGVAEDALIYVISVNAGMGPDLFHPNHLLYNFTGWVVLEAAKALGYQGDALIVMQMIGAISGSLCIVILYGLSMRLTDDAVLSTIICLACAGSYAFWWYSVEADTYILPLLIVLLAARLFVERWESGLFVFSVPVGILLGTAALYHQQHIFSAIAFAIAAFYLAGGTFTQRLIRPILILGISGGLTLGTYIMVGNIVIGLGSLGDIILWARGHAAHGLWTPFSVMSPIKSAVGLISSVYGLDFVFSSDWIVALFRKAFPTTVLIEERFLAQRLSWGALLIAFTCAAASATAGLWLIVRAAIVFSSQGMGSFIGGAADVADRRRKAAALFLSYFVVHFFIITLWHPLNIEFWIAVLPFMYLLAGMGLSRSTKRRLRIAAGVFAGSLILANLVGTILPQTNRTNDYWYVQNAPLLSALKPGDLVVTEGGYVSNSYVRYFGPEDITVVTTGRMPIEEVEVAISNHPRRIVFSSWAFTPPRPVLESGQLLDWNPTHIAELKTMYGPQLKPLISNDRQSVYLLTD